MATVERATGTRQRHARGLQPGRRRSSPTTSSTPTPPLQEALERENAGWGVDRVRDLGEVAGSVETREHADRCERNEPRLVTHDRYGNRVDQVDLDPSWHWLLQDRRRARDPVAAVARPASPARTSCAPR